MGKQVAHGDVHAERLPHGGHRPHREQRVPAELEEMIGPADALVLEELAPEAGQFRFGLALRALRRLGWRKRLFRARAGLCGRSCRWA
ncbi:hypothetical protein CCY86_01420 [Ralstonia solanacearum]|nr:hypothetical protein CCY86_01420 [Ralstonia solanacearum]